MRRFLSNDSLPICPLRTSLRLFAWATLFLLTPLISCRESVGPELARLQQNRGYRLVSVRDNKVFTLSFAEPTIDQSKPFISKGTANTGTVSPDGKRVAFSLCLDPGIVNLDAYRSECSNGFVLAIVDPDGSDLREYRDFANPGPGICWSHDMSKLVLTMNDKRQASDSSDYLQIVDLKSGQTEVISDGSTAFVDSQCWSPDDKQIVYTVNKPLGVQTVRLYEVQAKKSKDLASGGYATWSPDGKWIAFLGCPPSLRGCNYYGIRVSTGEPKFFFKADAETGLSWSPDSRFVAYVSAASFSERTPSGLTREMRRLRVRRLEDTMEYSFADFFDGDIMWFDWVS